ncbi:MAG: S9 family peptidase [Bacteroidota bacterium]
MAKIKWSSLVLLIFTTALLSAQNRLSPLQELDIFEIEYASDPQIAPNGDEVVYRRMGFDIMNDRPTGNLWIVDENGKNHRKLTSKMGNESQARWSPEGDRIAFVSSHAEGTEVYMYWRESGQVAQITQLENSPSNLAWSPDGKWLAFTMKVSDSAPVLVTPPRKPKGAKWASPPRITDRLKHEADGQGYLAPGYTHIFLIPSDGGTPQQLSFGKFNYNSQLSWTPDSKSILFSANLAEDWEYSFRNSEIYKVNIQSGEMTELTNRNGPDTNPIVSPDGRYVAYLSFEDRMQAYQIRRLYLMDLNGAKKQLLCKKLDRSISNIVWNADSKGVYFSYDDFGNTKIGFANLDGDYQKVADNMGGTTIGRPYASGSFSVAENGKIAYTYTTPELPSDVAILPVYKPKPRMITRLNEDLLGRRKLGKVESITYNSSVDGRKIQGWIVYPPNYVKGRQYPLIVENHGGPILNYGDRFTAEIQLYAAAGYVVFYPNPRGSTSYGEKFGNLLYHNYPGEDFNDVMDGVDNLIARDLVDEEQLFVTGGSAGGIMTAWIIGKTNQFKAAVVAKPVMNWISKTLVADNYYGYANTRYPGQPWENWETYWRFSPISLVGNVQTPTMVMVGMNDLRTPPSEAKQLYHALKLRKIETVLVEIPGASHGIARRPSQLITKVAHALAWFEKYRSEEEK